MSWASKSTKDRPLLRSLWHTVGIPMAAFALFLLLWSKLSANIETSFGQIPGPAAVWRQTQALWADHIAERERAVAFYERQKIRTAARLAQDPSAKATVHKYTGKPTYIDQIAMSLKTVFAGFLLATLIAVPIGVLCGLSTTVNRALDPFIQLFKPVSPLAWLPLVTMVMSALYVTDDPTFEKSFVNSVITVTLCSIWATIINTGLGVKSIDRDLMNVARVLQLGLVTRLFKLVLPASLPHIFTGLRLSLGVSWMVLIAAEIFTQSPGLGKFVWDEFQNGSSTSLARIMVAALTIGLIGFLLDRSMYGVQSLLSCGARYLAETVRQRTRTDEKDMHLPDVIPITSSDYVPKAVRVATRTKIAANIDKFVEFYNVTRTVTTSQGPLTVVDRFQLDVKKGEFISLIGHSGCGKSTILSMVAGLTDVTDGSIILDGHEVATAGPDRGVVFQAPNLLPWLTARENVAVGVRRVYPHASPAERWDITKYYLARVGLSGSLDKRASELSNGMKQRVGLARAFALSPKLLLLDEPFGMLDTLTRWELQEVLMEIWQRTRVTAICATHDVDEAILLADRIVMMTSGPQARIGNIMHVDLPRPRTRKALLEHPKYYSYREELMSFLEEYEHRPVSEAA